jgi:hypothetical protein
VAACPISASTVLDYQRNLLPQLPPALGLGACPKS